MKKLAIILFLLIIPIVSAEVVINEIMYNPKGSDEGHEWVEIYSNGAVNLSGWKFYEGGTNHTLTLINGSWIIDDYVIIVDNWSAFLEDYPNYDGNLIDATALGAIAALLKTKVPRYENKKVIYGEYEKELPLKDVPIAITVTKISDELLVDLGLEEESALDARITISTNEKGDICSLQKGGKGYFTTEELEKAADLSILKGKELRKLIK